MPSEDKKREDEKIDEAKAPEISGELQMVVEKINAAESVLVTLSRDPSVDDIAAAIGLTLALSNSGKHTTAIYSGKTPNALEFLKPEKTFETNTNSLQDFIIALAKDKADHLRYKIEGDFVKVYITPYKTTITENDLEFSHGDVNVDLVVSLNVKDENDLDAALAEHGRILHGAEIVNISNGEPGGMRGVKWNDEKASSVSEMVVKLIDAMAGEAGAGVISADIATALLTGIEAATDRFSNEKTTPVVLALSSRLMGAGADQQLIVSNIMKKDEPEAAEAVEAAPAEEVATEPALAEVTPTESTSVETVIPEPEAAPEIEAPVAELPKVEVSAEPEPASVAPVTETSVEPVAMPVTEAPVESAEKPAVEAPAVEPAAVSIPKVPVNEIYQTPDDMVNMQDGTMAPVELEKPKDYGAMMEEELASSEPEMNPAISATPAMPIASGPVEPVTPIVSGSAVEPAPVESAPVESVSATSAIPMMGEQPAVPVEPAAPAPVEPVMPTVQEPATVVPEPAPVAPAPAPVEPVAVPQPVAPDLPPAPAPNIDGMALPPTPSDNITALPPVQQDASALDGMPATADGNAPAAPAEPVNPVVVQPDPTAFKIPGM